MKRAIHTVEDAINVEELANIIGLGHGTGAPLYGLADALMLFQSTLLGSTEPVRFHVLESSLPEYLVKLYRKGQKIGIQQARTEFDVPDTRSAQWAQQHAAELVTNITESARASIRTLVSEGFTKGVNPRTTAKMIQKSIGLTERDAQAVMNKHLTLLAEGSKTAEQQALKYAQKLVRRRAETIAIHETSIAANEGQRDAWQQAREQGLLTGHEKKTLIQVDPCPICAEMTGEVVPIFGEFSGGLPPFHVNCRCTEGIV